MIKSPLSIPFDLVSGALAGQPVVERRLSDLRGLVYDPAALEAALQQGDPVIYTVSSAEVASGEGDLAAGLGILYPGLIGEEYVFTKGHLHAWRPAAEIYIGLSGEGRMLLEDEASGESRLEALRENTLVYVPGGTAHRTLNTGLAPLVYLGIYPVRAGHDYSAIAARNFRKAVLRRDGQPVLIDR